MAKKSIIPGDRDDICFICQRYQPLDVHHCLHGSYRKAADEYGLTVHLCRDCHRELHDKGTFDKELEEIAQITFERIYGKAEFMRIFGKSFKSKED